MRIVRCGLTFAVTAALLVHPSVAAAGPADLDLTIVSTPQGLPVVDLVNRGTQPCQVITTDLGTIDLPRVVQAGQVVQAQAIVPSFDDDLGYQLSKKFRTLASGESIRLPLTTDPVPTGFALRTVSWSAPVTVGSVYAVKAGEPIDMVATYTPPVLAQSGPAMCPSASGSGSVGPASGAGGPTSSASGRPGEAAAPADKGQARSLWLWIAGAAVLLVLVLVAVLLIRRRSRLPSGALAVVLLAGILGLAPPPPPAAATISTGPGAPASVGACLDAMRAPGGDPAGILPTLDDPSHHITISLDSENGENRFDRNNVFVHWNPTNDAPFSDGVARLRATSSITSCTTLSRTPPRPVSTSMNASPRPESTPGSPSKKSMPPKRRIAEELPRGAIREASTEPIRSHRGPAGPLSPMTRSAIHPEAVRSSPTAGRHRPPPIRTSRPSTGAGTTSRASGNSLRHATLRRIPTPGSRSRSVNSLGRAVAS